MKKILSLLLILAFCATCAYAKKEEPLIPEYLIEGGGPAKGNDAKVKVTIYAKKKDDVTDQMLAKAAVHGVLFKGYQDNSKQGSRASATHPPLASSPTAYDQNADFFVPFFTNGNYMNYVSFIDDGRSVVKSGKQYKVSAIVNVNKNQLTKDLQAENVNVIKSLGTGW